MKKLISLILTLLFISLLSCLGGNALISSEEDGIVEVEINIPAGKEKTAKPLIYDEEALTEQLKGEDKEAVIKILGEPAVKKPSKESGENLEYWWYSCI